VETLNPYSNFESCLKDVSNRATECINKKYNASFSDNEIEKVSSYLKNANITYLEKCSVKLLSTIPKEKQEKYQLWCGEIVRPSEEMHVLFYKDKISSKLIDIRFIPKSSHKKNF
jgi:hypothetical protein